MIPQQIIPKICYKNQIKFLKFVHKDIIIIKKQIKDSKININKFFNFYNFILIYFFIGNFYIKNKLSKTLTNIINLSNSCYQLGGDSLNIQGNLLYFLKILKEKNIRNINNSLFKVNSEFYLPKTLLNINFSYFNILFIYLKNIKLIFNFINIYLLKFIFFINTNKDIDKFQSLNIKNI